MCHVNVWRCHLGLLLVRVGYNLCAMEGEIAKLCETLQAIDSIHFQVDDLVLPHNCCYPLTWQQCCLLKRLSNSLFCMEFTMLPFGKMANFWSYDIIRYQKKQSYSVFFVNVQFWSTIKALFEHDFLDFLTGPDPASGSTKMAKSCQFFFITIFSLHRKTAPKPWWRWKGGFLRIMINS